MHSKHKTYLSVGLAVVVILGLLFVLFGLKMLSDQKYLRQGITIGKKLDPQASEQSIVDNLKRNQKITKLAINSKLGINLEEEFRYETYDKNSEYQKLLQDYFNSDEKLFKEYVTKPLAYEAVLRIYYNVLHQDQAAYARAQDILKQLESGQSFEELAKTGSDDKVSGQIGGDLGFVSEGQIPPELFEAVKSSEVGKVNKQIQTSRLGYHILYPLIAPEVNGQKVWHLKHILVRTEGFESWLNSQL